MSSSESSPKTAGVLFNLTIIISALGVFAAIYFWFDDVKEAVYIASFTLVGLIGIVSFLRHSIFYRSDQARMGWHQDRPEFQIEVGFSNLAIGVAAIVVVALDLGLIASAVCLLTYGIYLGSATVLHGVEFARRNSENRNPAKIINSAFFSMILIALAVLALMEAGAL
ncbi:MAG TPA: DUF6790 family protein [Methanomassiliicoccales archaeon]|nr:DUF6790 family protein [Methanomassiliicoccales archaeon]